MKYLVLAALLAAPVVAHSEPLELVCQGTALHTEASETFADASNSYGGSASGSATTFHRERSAETMRIRLDGQGGGRLKLPASLIPPISIGKDGWWDFVQLDVTDDAIHGEISLNLINKPKVVIDRHTGDIDMRGYRIRFQGSCERAPDAAAEKKF
jgi:hypothetical protein